ncbi:Intracellular serine protease [Streptomyces hundungensis]|uniref:Intracellular serine protease n=1 Tax=Streptomyces hundungensis TaxID=1077946 RepID=A0A387H752_9ACTN|nr:S8 family serine peptidase [Streptomyces hundungensis]AYG79646.1 Intracellular serine protease [Streptomyces hundungensis]
MRPISRTALGVAAAAALAVTAVAPSVAAPRHDDTASTAERPLVGGATSGTGQPATVTLVTGDKVVVSRDRSGAPTGVTALPREDGSVPLVQTRRSGQELYVYPDGAAGALAAGSVDEELFNVSGLIRQGYDDAHTKTLPLIAVYDHAAPRSARAVPRGAKAGLNLPAVNGTALTVDKVSAAHLWADVANSRTRAASSGIKKLWLDRKVTATLDRSARQIRADLAWAAGYDGKGTKVAVLDTGVDAEHPDLKGRVTDAKNFTDSPDTEDRQGHGTHTTSTVGGSGAASDGKKKGIAPGTGLMVGKVLNDSGSGDSSWIIAGMQWAVDNKADVVSMSLGSPVPTDCTDPMSIAAQELATSAPHTLFVVAAGNSGPGLNTVSSPGCAPGVLTVGAVDRDDTTAGFSSRGPAPFTHTLKPEITAPGVGISAANAGGRGVYAYQTMSGTSMATPHVAGAAAIVRQRHPDWSAQQIKAALVSSADSAIPGDVRETGGGRLDVKAAIDTTVLGAPAVQAGTFDWPQDKSDRTTVDVPYTNLTDKPLRLDLKVAGVTGNDGSPVNSRVAKLSSGTVTVPAGATAKVPLAIDPTARLAAGQYGDVTGRVLATANGVQVSTPFALYVEPETLTLRVKLVDRQGGPAAGASSLDVIGTDTATGERRFNDGATDQVYRLRPGAYFVSSFVTSPDPGDATGADVGSVSYLGRPQLDLKKDTTLVLDARSAHRLSLRTERPSEVRTTTLDFARSWGGQWLHSGSLSGSRLIKEYFADVRGDARTGDFEFGSYWRAYAPQFDRLGVVGGPELHPLTASVGSDNLDGTGRAPLVDAGRGTPEELKAAGVAGKVAFVAVPDGAGSLSTLGKDAKAAGATALLVHRPSAGRWLPAYGFTGGPLPTLSVEAAEAKALTDRLSGGPVTLTWKATAKSGYVYNLGFQEDGGFDSDRVYRVRDGQLGRNASTYHSMGVPADFVDGVAAHRPDGRAIGVSGIDLVAVPSTRTEFYTPGPTTWDHFVSSSFPFGEFMLSPPTAYRAGKQTKESWYDGVVGPDAGRDGTGEPLLAAERQGDLIGFAPGMWGDTEHSAQPGSFGDIGSLLLRRDGKDYDSSGWPSGVFTVPADDAAYELISDNQKIGPSGAVWKRSTETVTSWKFRSHREEKVYSQGIPLLFPHYDVPDDALKTVPAADGQKIGLTVTGHAGYTPAGLVSAALSYSYDGGATWTKANSVHQGGSWMATVNHAGASAKNVTLRAELTDANGNSVTQTVVNAYAVR